MKKLSILLLSLLLAAGTAACGGNHTNTASGAASSAESGAASKASAAKETSSAPQSSAEERPVINVITEPLAEETDVAPGTSDTPDAADRTYTITFAGDILMDPGYSAGAALTQRGAEGSFDEEALALMRGADLFVVNNEFAWTAGGTAVSKEYNFRADPKHVHILTDMGADLVTLGNNHTYDYGEEGLLDTLNTLDQEGIPYIGAGKTQADAGSMYNTPNCYGNHPVQCQSSGPDRRRGQARHLRQLSSGTPLRCSPAGKSGIRLLYCRHPLGFRGKIHP